MRLINSNGHTSVASGSLESSTFDTGSSSSTYTTLNWEPTSQDPAVTVKFQLATNNTNDGTEVWNFVGPDGTSGTYYTTPGSSISPANNNKRYVRYKAYLSTTDNIKNPTVTGVNVNYVSGCFTPGQVIFPGLANSNSYQVVMSLTGYATKTISNLNVSGYQTLQVLLTAN
jgi:hypothetical protein